MKKRSYLFALMDMMVLALLTSAVALYFIELRGPEWPEFHEPVGTFAQEPTIENLENNIVKISWSLPQQYETSEILLQEKQQLSAMRPATKNSITGGVRANVRFDEETQMYVYEGLFEVGSCTDPQKILEKNILCNFNEGSYTFQAISFTSDAKVASQLQTMEISK